MTQIKIYVLMGLEWPGEMGKSFTISQLGDQEQGESFVCRAALFAIL